MFGEKKFILQIILFEISYCIIRYTFFDTKKFFGKEVLTAKCIKFGKHVTLFYTLIVNSSKIYQHVYIFELKEFHKFIIQKKYFIFILFFVHIYT